MVEVETILLASYVLKGTVVTKIHADIPWQTRANRRMTEPQESKEEKNARSIIIHGVPELTDDDPAARYLYDCIE